MTKLQNAREILKVGDYVNYQPSLKEYGVTYWQSGVFHMQMFYPSKMTSWRVFQIYAGQVILISTDVVGVLAMGGVIGYTKLVKTLNEIAMAHVNPKFALRAQSIGCTDESLAEIEEPESWRVALAKLTNLFPYTDKHFNGDWTRIRNYELGHSLGVVWLASRSYELRKNFLSLRARAVSHTGKLGEKSFYEEQDLESKSLEHAACGVRCKVFMRPELKVVAGNGTPDEPYEITV